MPNMKRWKKLVSWCISLASGESINEPDANGYKYFAILEFGDMLLTEMEGKIKENDLEI